MARSLKETTICALQANSASWRGARIWKEIRDQKLGHEAPP